MKAFLASYNWYGAYQAFDNREYVVFAETESVALGLALEANKDTKAGDWSFEEIDPTVAAAHYAHNACT